MRLALGEKDSVTVGTPAAATIEVHEEVEEEEEETFCAICFEHKHFVNLPCACKVNYCGSCWDRALASSVSLRGRAQCPSCRAAFQVDFDPLARGLVFSRDAGGGSGSGTTEWRSRVYGKAKSVQIELLRDYGATLAAHRGMPSVAAAAAAAPGASPGRGAATEGALGSEMSSAQSPIAALPQPLCVCGAHLEKVTSRRRVERMLQDADSGLRLNHVEVDRLVDRLVNSALVTCDLCEDVATRSGAVWTCENGPHTVLHPAAYDVCERCFREYVGPGGGSGGDGELLHAAGSHGGRGGSGTTGMEEDTSRCASCIAAIRRAVPLPWPFGRRSNGGTAIGRPRPTLAHTPGSLAPTAPSQRRDAAAATEVSPSSPAAFAPLPYELLVGTAGLTV
eukprot:CAMPEP_0115391018 /NCGR_PEP_ID=MMETSP0271-20121206/10497_1 /TAXON_ID=71861 /ORGANISM="Scrippsiella trochoidea, Strain CCMP3099" /LENGTH=392 /DNA_ID=CAMNT_0002814571 /DNA_START=34 /DNA_END=1212 /DNA_ORIENTATION=+